MTGEHAYANVQKQIYNIVLNTSRVLLFLSFVFHKVV